VDAPPAVTFGVLLRRYRVAAGLTQEELAELASISRRSISDMECGVPHRPRRDTVTLLAEALNLAEVDRSTFIEAARQRRPDAPAVVDGELYPPSGAQASPPLVGRIDEIKALARLLRCQGPPALFWAGEPGIGKSRLLQVAAPLAVEQRWCVLRGGCQRQGGHQPYAPLLEALQGYILSCPPDRLRLHLQGCAWLVRLLPELAGGPIPPLPPWRLAPEQEHRLMTEAVRRFLANVAGPSGTCLVLDDLQWAGPDALDLLALLVRSTTEIPQRVIGAYRETEVGPQDPLFVLLAELASAGLASWRSLQPLAPDEAAELLHQLLEGTGAGKGTRQEDALKRAGGVPFFLVSCAQGLRSGEAGHAVPWDVGQSIRRRVAALPTTAREFLGIAAVVGRVVPRVLLVGATTRPEEEILEAFDAACQARLLEETGEDGYQFVHDVIREVVEADLGAARRRVLHRRVADVLEQKPVEPLVELMAYHYARSDATEKAAPYLEQAGDRAEAQYAHMSAVTYYSDLVDLLDEFGRSQDGGRACEKLGAALYRLGRYDAALPVLERTDEVYRVLRDLEGRRRTLAQIGWLHAVRGTQDDGIARIQSALNSLDPDTPSPGLVALYVALGQLYGVSGRYRESLAAANRAVEVARVTADSQAVGAAVATRSDYLVMHGRFDEALLAAAEAVCLTEQSGDLQTLCTAYTAMIGAHINKGEFVDARLAGDRAVEVAQLLGDPRLMILAHCSRASVTLATGEWDLARVDIETAVSLGRKIGPSGTSAYALLQLGRYCLYTGEWENAAQHLEECVATAAGSQQTPWAQTFLAELDLLRGHPERARERLLPVLDRADPTDLETLWVGGVRPTLARAYLELGDLAGAENLLTLCLARVRQTGSRGRLVHALRVQATLETRRGRWVEAVQALEEALLLAHGISSPYDEGWVQEVYGQMHIERREPEQARERLAESLEIFRRLGAKKDVERTEQALAKLSSSS
jgi:tetratricopeptide (TPR) repeat protein/transcriptional regulator with XRE-family HTH domain